MHIPQGAIIDLSAMQTPKDPRQNGWKLALPISPQKLKSHLQKMKAQELEAQKVQALKLFQHKEPQYTHEEQLAQHRRKHPLYNPENLPVLSDHDSFFQDQAPMRSEAEYADLLPEFNEVSHHLLDTTAFTPHPSMSAATSMRASSTSVSACYTRIAQRGNANSCEPLIFSDKVKIDTATLDYDRTGILFEHAGRYYVMFEVKPGCVRGGFIWKKRVGMEFVHEWEAVAKRAVGPQGVGATGVDGGWWHSYGRHIMALRGLCAKSAERLQRDRVLSVKRVEEVVFGWALEKRLDAVVGAYWEVVGQEKEMVRKEVRCAWEEFVVEGWDVNDC